jgi:putative ABC transport system ATP-binding protein
MQSETIIETIDLTKIYGEGDSEVVALDQVNISIRSGEFVAIMGPSGSGKSTLLNILACMDRPTDGQFILAGEDVSDYSRADLAMIRSRQLGFVFQSFNLLARASALDNVMLPLIYRREDQLTHHERVDLAMSLLEMVGLTDRAHHLPNQLSGGQQQRVAIARALVNDPVLILADEPTGNLDTKSSVDIIDLLKSLNDRGRTVVMVTHEPDIAHYSNRIIHIRDGKVFSDTPNGKRPVHQQSPEAEQAAGTSVWEAPAAHRDEAQSAD